MSSFRRLPPIKIWGASDTVKPIGLSTSPLPGTLGAGNWPQMMLNFYGQADPTTDPDLFVNWIRPQIDYLATLGGNTIAFSVGVEAIWNHGMNKTTLLQNVADFCDYVISKGMYVSISVAVNETNPAVSVPTTTPSTFVAQDCADIITTAVAHGMVWGDITNEFGSNLNNNPAVWTQEAINIAITEYVNLVRAQCPNLTIALDLQEGGVANVALDPIGVGGNLDLVDLLSVHNYDQSTNGSIISQLYSLSGTSGKSFYDGEFGISVHDGSGTLQDRTTYVNNIITNNLGDSRCIGSLAWAVLDQGGNGNQWGICDYDGTSRPTFVTPYNTVAHVPATPFPATDLPPQQGYDGVNFVENWLSLANWTPSDRGICGTTPTYFTPANNDICSLRFRCNANVVYILSTTSFTDSSFGGALNISTGFKLLNGADIAAIQFGGYGIQWNGSGTGTITLYRVSTSTTLATVTVTLTATSYSCVGYRSGTSVKFALQRVSDGMYLTSAGTFSSGFQWAFNVTDGSPASTGNPIKVYVNSAVTNEFLYYNTLLAGSVGVPAGSPTSATMVTNATKLLNYTNFTGARATGAVVSGSGTYDNYNKIFTAPSTPGTTTVRFTGMFDTTETADVIITITSSNARTATVKPNRTSTVKPNRKSTVKP